MAQPQCIESRNQKRASSYSRRPSLKVTEYGYSSSHPSMSPSGGSTSNGLGKRRSVIWFSPWNSCSSYSSDLCMGANKVDTIDAIGSLAVAIGTTGFWDHTVSGRLCSSRTLKPSGR